MNRVVKRVAGWLAVVAALSAITVVSVNRFAHARGKDFYHFWAVASAIRAGNLQGTDFYTSPEQMESVLQILAQDSGDPRQLAVSERRKHPHLTGTPTLYWLFSVMPRSYSPAFAVFVTLLTASLVAALVLLFRAYGFGTVPGFLVAAAVVVAYPPFRWDFDVGNVNSFQLLALSALAAWMGRSHRRRTAGAPLELWILPLLTSLVMIKPSIVVPAAAIGWVAILRSRVRTTLAAAGVSTVVAAALGVIPLLYFGTWNLWAGWWTYVSGGRDEGLLFPTLWGNRSTVMLLHEEFGMRPVAATALALAVFTTLAAVGAACRKRESGLASRLTGSLRELGSDPFRAATAGVVLTCATSVVYWPHYFLFCLWGALAMTLSLRRRPIACALALTSIVLGSELFTELGTARFSQYAAVACWMLITPLVFLDGHESGAPA